MVLARVANFFTNGDSANTSVHHNRQDGANTTQAMELPMADTTRRVVDEEGIDSEAARPPYLHVRMPNRALQRHELTQYRQCWQEE